MGAPAAADPPMIRMVGVHKHFGSLHVLCDINLGVARGEVVVVLGPSGPGKSTLCRSINRLEPIDPDQQTRSARGRDAAAQPGRD